MTQAFSEPCSRGVIEAEPCPRTEISPRRRRWVLGACIIASSMAFIDGSVLTVALPALRADFGADYAAVQWVLNGYVLALASLTLIGGALADAYGKARMLTIGCLLFGLASAACALAPTAAWLIAARAVQGAAAAILTPASLALIGAAYPEDERSGAIGAWAAASALTTALGPVLGGWLTENYGWPSIFWINPPLAVLALSILLHHAPADRRRQRGFDVTGAVILAASLGALAWVLSQAGDAAGAGAGTSPAASPVEILAAAGLGLAGLFAYAGWEGRSPQPMTPPRLRKNSAFLRLNIMTLLVYTGLALMFFLLPFELIDRRGLSATATGLVFLPFTLGVGLLSRRFGNLADRIGPRTLLIAGPTGAALAYTCLALTREMSLVYGVILPMAVLGVSFAVFVAPLTAAVMSSVDSDDEGLASGVNNAASRIAQLAGVALAAGVASLAAGYQAGLAAAALVSLAGAAVVATGRTWR